MHNRHILYIIRTLHNASPPTVLLYEKSFIHQGMLRNGLQPEMLPDAHDEGVQQVAQQQGRHGVAEPQVEHAVGDDIQQQQVDLPPDGQHADVAEGVAGVEDVGAAAVEEVGGDLEQALQVGGRASGRASRRRCSRGLVYYVRRVRHNQQPTSYASSILI